MSEQGRNITETILTQIPIVIFGLISGIFLTRLLGPEGKGTYALFQANSQLLSMFLTLSFSNGIVFFISNKKIHEKYIFGSSLLIILLATIIAFIFIFFNNPIQKLLIPKEFSSIFFKWYLFLLIEIGIINTFFSSYFQGRKIFRIVNILNFLNSIFNIVIFGFVFILYENNYYNISNKEIFLLTVLIILFQTIIYSVLFLKQNVSFLVIPPKNILYQFYKYSFGMYLTIMVNFFNYRLAMWFIVNYSNTTELGYYSLSFSVGQLILTLTNAITLISYSYLSSQTIENGLIKLSFLSRINTFFMIIISLILFFFSNILIQILYGHEFNSSVLPLKIIIFGQFFLSLSSILAVFIMAKGNIYINALINSICLILTIILNEVFVPEFGIIGSSISYSMVFLSMFIMFNLYMKYKYKIQLNHFYLFKKNDFVKLNNFIKIFLRKFFMSH